MTNDPIPTPVRVGQVLVVAAEAFHIGGRRFAQGDLISEHDSLGAAIVAAGELQAAIGRPVHTEMRVAGAGTIPGGARLVD